MLNVIIAEDSQPMRLVLKKILADIPGIGELREACDGKQLVMMVEECKPDVIFLDVDMPVMNGLKAAKEIFDFNPKIILIFATAYDCFMNEAFEVYAFDYLIKPFNAQRISQTFKRIEIIKQDIQNAVVLQCIVDLNKRKLKLSVRSVDGLKLLNLADITFITRFDRKTVIHTPTEIISTNESLQQIECQISNDQFFRSHKGYIINAQMVREIVPWGSKTYLVKMANTTETALMTFEKVKEFREKYCIH